MAEHVRGRCLLCYWYLQGELAQRRHDPEAGRAYYDSAVSRYRELEQEIGFERVSRHMALAALGLGRREEAIRYVEVAAALEPWSHATSHYHRLESLAEVQIGIGDFDSAVGTLEELLAYPGLLSVPILEHDPLWDPLRGRPDFQRLLDEYR